MEGPTAPYSFTTLQWSTGIFGCFKNTSICIVGWLLPCVLFGQTADLLQDKNCLLYGTLFCVPFVGSLLLADQREVIRKIRGIPGSGLIDFSLSCFCSICALMQQSGEVEQLNQEGFAFPVQDIHPAPLPTISQSANDVGAGYGSTDREEQPQFVPTDFTPPSLDTTEVEGSEDNADLGMGQGGGEEVVVTDQPKSYHDQY